MEAFPPLAQRVAEARGEFQPASAAADDQDPMQRFFRNRPGLRNAGEIGQRSCVTFTSFTR